jgi:hypothetical protein
MRKSVLFWQKTPFDAFVGGDGLYLHKLKLHLVNSGWEVFTITSHVHRPYAFLTSRYHLPNNRLEIRGALRIRRFFVFNPLALLTITLNFLLTKALKLYGRELKPKLRIANMLGSKERLCRQILIL